MDAHFHGHDGALLLGICGLIKSQFLREKAGSASLLSQKLGFYFLASPLAGYSFVEIPLVLLSNHLFDF